MAKKGSGGNGTVILIGLVLAAIAWIPKEVWGALFALGIAYFVLKSVFGTKEGSGPAKEEQTPAIPNVASSTGFRIPTPPAPAPVRARWLRPGEPITLQFPQAAFAIEGGLLYIAEGAVAGAARVEPALINPKLPVSATPVDESQRLMNYWPAYSDITPQARRAYLQWLADGRKNPRADVGYVFLYFYGLERRALVDARNDPRAREDFSAIIEEVRRLLHIYGTHSGSFMGYASNFLEYLRLTSDASTPVYREEPPIGESRYELPLRMRLGLGQMAAAKVPVPPSWAAAWALADPNISRRTPVTRCPDVFSQIFVSKYSQRYGEGMLLPVNRTRLKCTYRPASSGLLGQHFSIDIGDIPDITATRAPLGRLQQLVDECTSELDGYSRFIGKNPEKKDSLEALLQLPPSFWPAPARAEIDDLRAKIDNGLIVMTLGELSGRLKSAGALTREKVLGLARALESMHVGIEPDVLSGGKVPKSEDTVVLFATQPEDGVVRANPAYQAAAVTVGLSYAVAAADGDVSAVEISHLTRQTESWAHLSAAHRKRLHAHLRLQMAQPTPLAAFKKKLEPLGQDARRTISLFLAHLAQVDGVIDPGEVKLLEKLYKLLGIEGTLLYSDLHLAAVPHTAVATRPGAASAATTPAEAAFTLDTERIAALQKETEKVTALLANVFAEPEAKAPLEEDEEQEVGLIGLDREHSAFVRFVLSRPSWAKQDLLDVASDMELMLEGALEKINEAFFDHFDEALTSGDDPIEVNQTLMEKMPA